MAGVETGNMLILTYAAALASGDGSLISRYVCQSLFVFTASELNQPCQYSILTSWADYLSNMSLNTIYQYVGSKNELPTIIITFVMLTGMMQMQNGMAFNMINLILLLRASLLLGPCQK